VGSQKQPGYVAGVARVRGVLGQVAAEAAGEESAGAADEGGTLTPAAVEARTSGRRRLWRGHRRGPAEATPLQAATPEAPAPAEAAAAPDASAVVVPVATPAAAPVRPHLASTGAGTAPDSAGEPAAGPAENAPTALRRRRGRALRLARGLLPGVLAAGLTAGLWRLAGPGLQGWAVGLGMDDERGALLAALLVAAIAAAVVVAGGAGVGAARAGGVAALLGVEVVPFLVRGSRTSTTEGLTAHLRLTGWFLQPLGMVLLGILVISLGAAVGLMVRRDLAGLAGAVRRGRRGWLGVAAGVLLAAAATWPAITAIQDGPISALYDYSSATGPSRDSGGPALAAAGAQGAGGSTAARPAAPDTLPGRERPGHIVAFSVQGRSSLAYLPGDYAVETSRQFPVLYFLHGYPGNADDWVGDGAQLPQVLDQLISSGDLPPVIAVMPNGNGQTLSDAEWGDTQHGDRVEDWLVTRVVPEVDRRYRTLGTRFRGIAGLSSGAFGALNLAFRHPDVFRWAASYSGFFEARRDIFGPTTAANSPTEEAAQLPDTSRMPVFVGVGDTDKGYLAQQVKFISDLHTLGWMPVDADMVPGGHGWEAWRLEMVHSLEWLGGLWGSDPGTPLPCRDGCGG
jgi:enterochelin esterase-like enzyme